MKEVFQGQIIKTEDVEYDFIEIKGSETSFLQKTPFLIIPSHIEYLVINYYKVECTERRGLLQYDEFETLSGRNIHCIRTEVFKVDTPVEFQEFYKNGTKLLALKVKTGSNSKIKTDGNFKIGIENGTMIKRGCFYEVFGEGEYVFETEGILYKFQTRQSD